MKRSSSLSRRTPLKSGSGKKARPASPEDRKAALRSATLKLLEKAKREAERNGVTLSEWEDGFIEGVSDRVKTYGRAFADPDKGAMGSPLSLRQGLKLREIRRKVKRTRRESPEE